MGMVISRLVRRRTLWWPTWLGWLAFLGAMLVPVLLWAAFAEPFLCRTDRVPAEVLVVEGWIGIKGAQAAQTEFLRGNYKLIITAGTLTNNRWGTRRWDYATLARDTLLRSGVAPDKVLAVSVEEHASQRTYHSAEAVQAALAKLGTKFHGVNVFTLGAHARRSRLIYARAIHATPVGVVAWRPQAYADQPWWRSSERSEDLVKETLGYTLELLFFSGRPFLSEHKAKDSSTTGE